METPYLKDIRHPIPSNGGDWVAKFGETWKAHVARIRERFGDAIEEIRMPVEYPTDVPIVFVKRGSIVDVLRFAKTELDYGFLSDLTATDEETVPRFEVVYNLFSHSSRARLRFKTRVGEDQDVPTLTPVWTGADWLEREVWDMFGIRFAGHPNLRRILMDERWQGHPLRKDYPLRGYQVFTEPMAIDPTQLED